MADTDLFDEFLNKLKKDKSEAEVGQFLESFLKYGATELYLSMVMMLTDEDYNALEKITDKDQMEEEVRTRFKLRTGKTPEEFVVLIRDSVAKNYLFPVLNPQLKNTAAK